MKILRSSCHRIKSVRVLCKTLIHTVKIGVIPLVRQLNLRKTKVSPADTHNYVCVAWGKKC